MLECGGASGTPIMDDGVPGIFHARQVAHAFPFTLPYTIPNAIQQ